MVSYRHGAAMTGRLCDSGNSTARDRDVSFTESIKTCFQKYIDFSGRASRSEFWWFALFNFIVSVALALLTPVAPPLAPPLASLQGIFILVVLLPSLTAAVRRLHDSGRSGWWALLPLATPVAGAILGGVLAWATVDPEPTGIMWDAQTIAVFLYGLAGVILGWIGWVFGAAVLSDPAQRPWTQPLRPRPVATAAGRGRLRLYSPEPTKRAIANGRFSQCQRNLQPFRTAAGA